MRRLYRSLLFVLLGSLSLLMAAMAAFVVELLWRHDAHSALAVGGVLFGVLLARSWGVARDGL